MENNILSIKCIYMYLVVKHLTKIQKKHFQLNIIK